MSDKNINKSQKTPPLPRNLRNKARESLQSNHDNDLQKNTDMSFSATDGSVDDELLNSKLTAGVDTDDRLPKPPVIDEGGDNYFNTEDVESIPVDPSSDDGVPNMPGAILRHAREKLGISQRQIAQNLKLRVNTIADIEFDRLNQVTAAPFTRRHIYNYAKLVNIDPNVVVTLYDNNVNAVAEVINNAMPVKKNRSYMYALALIALIAVSTGVYLVTDNKETDSKPVSDEIVIEQAAEPVVIEDTGSVSGEITAQASSEAQGEIKVDKNTLMAQEQAKALGSNLIKGKSNESSKDKSDDALVTTAIVKETQTAPAKNDASDKIAAVVAKNDKEQSAEDKKEQVEKKSDESAKAPVLSSNLKDISDKARLANRQGLASMNSASIAIKAPVTLIVKDSRGKVLATGSYEKGDKVNVSGIPPLEISLSDTRAVSVSYMGGSVSVPDAKQVKYKLPDR